MPEACPLHEEHAQSIKDSERRNLEIEKHVAIIADNSAKTYAAVQDLIRDRRDSDKALTLVEAEQKQQRKEIEILFQKDKTTLASIQAVGEKVDTNRAAIDVRLSDVEENRIKPLEAFKNKHDGGVSAWKSIPIVFAIALGMLSLIGHVAKWISNNG